MTGSTGAITWAGDTTGGAAAGTDLIGSAEGSTARPSGGGVVDGVTDAVAAGAGDPVSLLTADFHQPPAAAGTALGAAVAAADVGVGAGVGATRGASAGTAVGALTGAVAGNGAAVGSRAGSSPGSGVEYAACGAGAASGCVCLSSAGLLPVAGFFLKKLNISRSVGRGIEGPQDQPLYSRPHGALAQSVRATES